MLDCLQSLADLADFSLYPNACHLGNTQCRLGIRQEFSPDKATVNILQLGNFCLVQAFGVCHYTGDEK